MNKVFALLLFFFSIIPLVTHAQENQSLEVVSGAMPERFAISHNVVFVVDASSTINRYEAAKRKFDRGWEFIVQQFASDELYFRVYNFHDVGMEKRTKWIDAGGPRGLTQFRRAKKWIKENTGIYSWGLKAIRAALREKNPLDKNPSTAARLTVVLFTDGGLTEAADADWDADPEALYKSELLKHPYKRYGTFAPVTKMIEIEQQRRINRGLAKATIVCVGLQNIAADRTYGTSVKRPESECQSWLLKIGKKYKGGYFHVRFKK